MNNRKMYKACVRADIDTICELKGGEEPSQALQVLMYLKNLRLLLDKRRREIPHLGILCTSFCNLNCKKCADCIPIRPNVHYSYENMKKDLSKVLSTVDYIHEVLLIGGEVFLYPDLDKILKFCLDKRKIGKIVVATNGTIIPSPPILSLLKNRRVYVKISEYKCASSKQRKLLKILKRNGISNYYMRYMTWGDIGNFSYRNRKVSELKEVFQRCGMRSCITMSNGKIFFCSRQMTHYELKIADKGENKEYIDVRNMSKEKFSNEWDKFYSREYLHACNYCDGLHERSPRIPAGEQG